MMLPGTRPLLSLFAAALAASACVSTRISSEEPKVVRGQALPPYEIVEECLRMEIGDRAEFTFDSTEPVDFNFHYHEGKTIVMPLVREKTRSDAGIFAAQIAQDYCLMWEAGPAGALLDYRVRLKRTGS